jgi:hypothetical protein
MKFTALLPKFFCMAILCACFILSCKKNDNGGTGNPPPGNPGSSANADSLSDHLQFFGATKKQGAIPKGPTGSSLKISFKDTLFLVDQVKMPIKFQHLDTTQNVAGVYLQIQAAVIGGSFASYYYDVPEVPVLDSSDTVSVIMIGIDPAGFKLPLSFNITITPHNSSGQPLAQAVRPVKIVEHSTDPKGTGGSCGLVLPNDGTWDWVMSYMEKNTFTSAPPFTSSPEKIFGADGQNINGSCCAGTSVYGICPKETKPNTHLHFNTFYQIAGEQLSFIDGSSFIRRTVERGANPLPDSSNFCLPFEGLVKPFLHETFYSGHYTLTPAILPPDLRLFHDSLQLSLITDATNPKGGGYGNSGGIIHFLDCNSLVLIEQDREGFGQHLYKIYKRNIFERWFEF